MIHHNKLYQNLMEEVQRQSKFHLMSFQEKQQYRQLANYLKLNNIHSNLNLGFELNLYLFDVHKHIQLRQHDNLVNQVLTFAIV